MSLTDNPGVRQVLGKYDGLAKVAAAAALYEAGQLVYDRAKSTWKDRFAYTVTVTDEDAFYLEVHEWLLTFMPEERRRALVATTLSTRVLPSGEVVAAKKGKSRLRLLSNDRKAREVSIDGFRVSVEVERAEAPTSASARIEPARIVFTCRSKSAQQAVLRHLEQIVERNQQTAPVLRMVDHWGDWVRRSDLPPRRLESVIIPKAQRDRIVTDLRQFLASEEEYVRRGIPWHRGLILHGPPGTGKTSLAKALAYELGVDLWYVSLSDLDKEASLMNLLHRIEPRSVALLEDIDTIRVSHDRKSKKGEIPMTSLLNALDGVGTPHGLISIMTTNHLEVLDPALTRPGRMDRVEKIDYPGSTEICELFEYFFRRPMTTPIPQRIRNVSQAEVAEILKRNLDDPDTAESQLHDAVCPDVPGTIDVAA